MRLSKLCLLAVSLLSMTALAQAQELPSSTHKANRLDMQASIQPADPKPGDEVTLSIQVNVIPGWHTYGSLEETGIPTSLVVEPQGLEVVGKPVVPQGMPHDQGGMVSYFLEGSYTVTQKLRVPADAAAGECGVRATVKYMACDDMMCDPPDEAVLGAKVMVAGVKEKAKKSVKALDLPASKHKANRLDMQASFQPAKAGPGDEVTLSIQVNVIPGWHTYGSMEETGIPTSLTVEPHGLEVVGKPVVPQGMPHDQGGMVSYFLEGSYTVTQKLRVPADAAAGEYGAKATVKYMACDDMMCDPPDEAELGARLQVEAGMLQPALKIVPKVPAKEEVKEPVKEEVGEKAEIAPPAMPSVHHGTNLSAEASIFPAVARAGEEVVLEIKVSTGAGWHAYGAGETQSTPISLQVQSQDLQLNGGANVPQGEAHPKDIGDKMITEYWLEGEFALRQKLVIPAGAEMGDYNVLANLGYQVCDHELCLDATHASIGASFRVDSGEARAEYLPQEEESMGGGTGSASKGKEDLSKKGLWEIILLAIGAGLFALVMPCTYPMIPITISFFTKQAEARGGSVLPLALLYGIGIVVTFVIIGLLIGPIVVPFATHPVTNMVLAGLFVFFALSLLGLIDLKPPAFLMNTASKASSQGGLMGVFLMGMTLCITSFTCTAPFVGSLLAVASQSGGIPRIILGMAVFGLTMAIPFVVLALVPGKLPRGGSWMNTAKVLFAFIEIAAALKFYSNAELVWGLESLPRELFLAIWMGIFLVAGFYLLGMIRYQGESGEVGGGRMLSGLCTVLLALYFGYGALGYPLENEVMRAFEPPYSHKLAMAGDGSGHSLKEHRIVEDDFDTAVADAKKLRKQVLLNFTGVT